MKKYIAAALCLVSLTTFAQNNKNVLSAAEIEAYKKRATGISNMAQSRSATFDESGEIRTDPKTGYAVSSAPGTGSMAEKGKYLSNMGGIAGYENQAEPGRGKVAAVKISGSGFADFSCNLTSTTQKSVLGRVIKYNGCDLSGSGTINSIKLSMCSVSLNGGACGAQDFTAVQTFPVNNYGTLDGLKVGVGCNESNKSCRVTLDDSYAVKGDGAALTAAAATKVANSGANSAQGITTERYTSDEYTHQMNEAKKIDACAGAAQASAANGTVSTCGEKPVTVGVGSNEPNVACNETPICVRRATRTVPYEQSCARTFPLTGHSCKFNVPKLECSVTKEFGYEVVTEKIVMTPSPTGPVKTIEKIVTKVPEKITNSCPDEQIADATKVRSGEGEAICSAKDKAGACTAVTWTDYYTEPKKAAQQGDCVTSPFPMSGPPATACMNKGFGVLSSCSDGGWYQRTLSDSECTVVRQDIVGQGRTVQTISHLSNSEKQGCGVCTLPTNNDTCYAQPTDAEPQDSCVNLNLSGCQMTSSTPQSQMNGLTLSQQETYSCVKDEESCIEYDRSNMCTTANTDMTFAVNKQVRNETTNTGAMNSAMTDAALIDAISEGAESNPADPMIPRIFGGDDSRCTKPVGFFQGIVDNDCCRMNIDRPGGNKIGNKCTMDEVKLATARRSNFTVFIGEYCSNKSGFGPFKRCTERTQTYCAFKGLLPRIIQQQGRAQLAGMATAGAGGSIQKANLNFNFYHQAGGWATPSVVNGVTIVPWQYPAYCANPEEAAKALTTDPNARECPLSLMQWIAVCEKPGGCGNLPLTPELGSEFWVMSTLNPLKNMTTAVSRYAMLTGACDPASTACKYEVAAWPAGIGGRAVASKELSFPLYAEQPQAAKSLSGIPQDISAMGDYIFRPVSVPGLASLSNPLPATVRIDVSGNGGKTFSTANVPSHISGTDTSLPGLADVRITGGCDTSTNMCTYHVTGTVTVTAKPWGSPENPDCSGYTLGQLGVLDFSKMDLSEWLASIMGSVQKPNSGALSAMAGTRAEQLMSARQSGAATVTSSNPQALRAAKVTPAEEFGPFDATLRVHGNFPTFFEKAEDNTDPVHSVDVDWGDCSVPQKAFTSGSGFVATHRFASPDQVPLACGGGRHSIAHPVKVRIHSKSGTHDLQLKVVNTWNTYTGITSSAGGTVNTSVTVAAPGSKAVVPPSTGGSSGSGTGPSTGGDTGTGPGTVTDPNDGVCPRGQKYCSGVIR